MDYKSAGVDIDAGNELVQRIKSIAAKTHRSEVLNKIGGFAGLFELPLEKYKHPVLVSSTDGVGTKLKLALSLKKHDTVGIDLVAMCVNDLIVMGAEPLLFLDYYATGHLNIDIATEVIQSIAEGCKQAGASLIGGETAEMPGMYTGQDYDLAGFCVGIIEKLRIIDGKKVKPGDVLIGIASSGPHANGYSLIRRIIEYNKTDLNMPMSNKTLGELLLEPTRIYVKPILSLLKKVDVRAIAHITGGGLIENLPRVLPNNCCAIINNNSWQYPEIFSWLQTQGNIANDEMHRTFNCGVGMIVCVEKSTVNTAIESLKKSGEVAWELGHIIKKNKTNESVVIQ